MEKERREIFGDGKWKFGKGCGWGAYGCFVQKNFDRPHPPPPPSPPLLHDNQSEGVNRGDGGGGWQG